MDECRGRGKGNEGKGSEGKGRRNETIKRQKSGQRQKGRGTIQIQRKRPASERETIAIIKCRDYSPNLPPHLSKISIF